MSKEAQNDQQKAQDKIVKPEVAKNETAVVNPISSLQRAYTDPRTLSPADAQTLQCTIGNQALGRLIIQRKMTIGPVGDKYEQEADAIAKQVVSKLHTTSSQTAPTQTAQRQEEEELQMKPLIQRQEEEELQMKPLPSISSLQRQEEEELHMKPLVQRQEEEELQAKGDPMLAGGELSGKVESSVQSAKSGGQPMSDNIRTPMEQVFNADFSGVRVHTGAESDTLNRSLSARAFTSGHDVFFRQGEYNPSSTAGQELLAHELTHVVQQNGGALQRKLYKDADTPLEEEHYETLKELLPDHEEMIDEFLTENDKYLISTFLYDYEITKTVSINGTVYTAQEPVQEKESDTTTEVVAPVAKATLPVVAKPKPKTTAAPKDAVAPKDVKLGKFLNNLGYKGSDPRVKSNGSVSNGYGKSANVHATQYLANTNQAKITAGTKTSSIMDNIFGGTPPTAYHLTAEVHGVKEPKRNPHLFYNGEYTANTPQGVKKEDLAKLLKTERSRIQKIIENKSSAIWT